MKQEILTVKEFNDLKKRATTHKGRLVVDDTDITIVKGKKKNKFHAIKMEYNGVKYDSKKEAGYAMRLDEMKRLGKVKDWQRQVKFPMVINGTDCGYYLLDFRVEYADGHKEYVDIKGYKKGASYQVFRIKKRIVEALYLIDITEI